MPREEKDTTIAGIQYRVTQLGASTGGQVMFRLARAFGSILAGLQAGSLSLEALDPADFDWLVRTMQTGTKVGIVDDAGGGTVRMIDLKLVFEDHFAGKYAELLEWLKFSLEVNFGPLPVALGNVIRGATALSSSTRPPASTGSPGGSSSPPA